MLYLLTVAVALISRTEVPKTSTKQCVKNFFLYPMKRWSTPHTIIIIDTYLQ